VFNCEYVPHDKRLILSYVRHIDEKLVAFLDSFASKVHYFSHFYPEVLGISGWFLGSKVIM